MSTKYSISFSVKDDTEKSMIKERFERHMQECNKEHFNKIVDFYNFNKDKKISKESIMNGCIPLIKLLIMYKGKGYTTSIENEKYSNSIRLDDNLSVNVPDHMWFKMKCMIANNIVDEPTILINVKGKINKNSSGILALDKTNCDIILCISDIEIEGGDMEMEQNIKEVTEKEVKGNNASERSKMPGKKFRTSISSFHHTQEEKDIFRSIIDKYALENESLGSTVSRVFEKLHEHDICPDSFNNGELFKDKRSEFIKLMYGFENDVKTPIISYTQREINKLVDRIIGSNNILINIDGNVNYNGLLSTYSKKLWSSDTENRFVPYTNNITNVGSKKRDYEVVIYENAIREQLTEYIKKNLRIRNLLEAGLNQRTLTDIRLYLKTNKSKKVWFGLKTKPKDLLIMTTDSSNDLELVDLKLVLG